MDFLNNPNLAPQLPDNLFSKYIMPTAAQQVANQPPQQAQQGPDPNTQMLLDALRKGTGAGSQPAQAGRVQSAGYLGQGMNTSAIGTALRPLFGQGAGIDGVSGNSTF